MNIFIENLSYIQNPVKHLRWSYSRENLLSSKTSILDVWLCLKVFLNFKLFASAVIRIVWISRRKYIIRHLSVLRKALFLTYVNVFTAWKMKFSTKDLFSKCDAGNCRFGHINWRNPNWKTSFFVQCFVLPYSFILSILFWTIS